MFGTAVSSDMWNRALSAAEWALINPTAPQPFGVPTQNKHSCYFMLFVIISDINVVDTEHFFYTFWWLGLSVSVWSLRFLSLRFFFFCSFVCFKPILGNFYFTQSHVHSRGSGRFCMSSQPCARRHFKAPLQLVQSTLARTHSSRPYCIYVSVLYYMKPSDFVLVHPQSCSITDGRPVFTE